MRARETPGLIAFGLLVMKPRPVPVLLVVVKRVLSLPWPLRIGAMGIAAIVPCDFAASACFGV